MPPEPKPPAPTRTPRRASLRREPSQRPPSPVAPLARPAAQRSPPIRRYSPSICGRMRLLRAYALKPRRRALLTPRGLRLSWQIVRDRRSVTLRRARTRVPSQPTPASVARALAVVEHATQTAVRLCEAISTGRNPLLVALDACAARVKNARLADEWRAAMVKERRARIPAPSPETPPTLVRTAGGRGCWMLELPAVQIRPPPRDPNHKPHPSTADLHLMRGGAWTPNPWRP